MNFLVFALVNVAAVFIAFRAYLKVKALFVKKSEMTFREKMAANDLIGYYTQQALITIVWAAVTSMIIVTTS